jgi:hypothetical protein
MGLADRTIKYLVPKKVGNVVTVERILAIKEGIYFMLLFTCGVLMVTVSIREENKTVNKMKQKM